MDMVDFCRPGHKYQFTLAGLLCGVASFVLINFTISSGKSTDTHSAA